jgi:hypothetical protein
MPLPYTKHVELATITTIAHASHPFIHLKWWCVGYGGFVSSGAHVLLRGPGGSNRKRWWAFGWRTQWPT